MFRMVPGVDLAPPPGRGSSVPPLGVIGGLFAVLAVSFLGLLATEGTAPGARPGETEMAQRSAAVVAGTYRGADVHIDRRDRALLVSYDHSPAISADRFAWAVCDTVRTAPDSAGSALILRDWQVVAMPRTGMPGSCRIAAGR